MHTTSVMCNVYPKNITRVVAVGYRQFTMVDILL